MIEKKEAELEHEMDCIGKNGANFENMAWDKMASESNDLYGITCWDSFGKLGYFEKLRNLDRKILQYMLRVGPPDEEIIPS